MDSLAEQLQLFRDIIHQRLIEAVICPFTSIAPSIMHSGQQCLPMHDLGAQDLSVAWDGGEGTTGRAK